MTKPVSEVYELASGGVIDGATTPPDALLGFKLDEVLNRMTFVPGSLGATVVIVSVNPDTWAKISEADQKAIMSVSGGVVAKRSGDLHVVETQTAIETMKAKGMTVDTMSDEELAKMKEAPAPLQSEWTERPGGRPGEPAGNAGFLRRTDQRRKLTVFPSDADVGDRFPTRIASPQRALRGPRFFVGRKERARAPAGAPVVPMFPSCFTILARRSSSVV